MNPLYRRQGARCPSELALDQLLAKELPAAETAEMDGHIATCETCQTRRRERLAEKDHFAATAPSLFPSAEPSARPRRGLRTALTAAAAMAAAFALIPAIQRAAKDDGLDIGERTKGTTALSFFVMHKGAVRKASAGEKVEPGDHLRFTFHSESLKGKDGERFAAILSRDGAGQASVYFPQGDASRAARVPGDARAQERPLSYSIQLDDTLGEEQIHVLLCNEPIALGPARAALAASATDWQATVKSACSIESHRIEKRKPQ